MKKTLASLTYILITGGTVVLMLIPSGCSYNTVRVYDSKPSSDGTDYKTFVGDKGNPHFSFEYPSYWDLRAYQPMPAYPGTSVNIGGSSETKNSITKHVEINISQFSENAETDMYERIAEYKRGSKTGISSDFVLKEKTRVEVAGIPGWEITVSYTFLPSKSIDGGSIDEPTPMVGRDTFFDYQGMVWRLSLYSNALIIEQANADFNHILQTFKILD